MYLFDTDHMSLIEHGGVEYERIKTHLRTVPPDNVATTIISYEEQTRGWLSRIAQMNTPERQISVYSELKRQLRNYCDIAVMEFDAEAAAEFKRLRQAGIRIGAMDLSSSMTLPSLRETFGISLAFLISKLRIGQSKLFAPPQRDLRRRVFLPGRGFVIYIEERERKFALTGGFLMSLVIDFAPEVESELQREAAREGIKPEEYVKRLVLERSPKKPLTGAELLAAVDADGLRGVYANRRLYPQDSPELTRELRRREEERKTGE